MARLKRNVADDIEKTAGELLFEPVSVVPRFDYMVSTGSTLLDLAICGGRIYGGGIPGGILVELYGPSASGKTALAVEIGISAQQRGGTARFNDPEGRLDRDYAAYYGLRLSDKDYTKADTVEDVFEDIKKWCAKDAAKDKVHVYICDSLAALSTYQELGESGDKVGAARAKMFSQQLRQVARLISNHNRLIVFTNQIRQNVEIKNRGGFGPTEITSGGEAIKFYASLRMRVGPSPQGSKLNMTRTIRGVETVKTIGINSQVYVAKSSVDDPYRSAPFTIIFQYGLDDLRANLDFLKEYSTPEKEEGSTEKAVKRYVVGDKSYVRQDMMIDYVEQNQLEPEVRRQVIELWQEIESHFKIKRSPRIRFNETPNDQKPEE